MKKVYLTDIRDLTASHVRQLYDQIHPKDHTSLGNISAEFDAIRKDMNPVQKFFFADPGTFKGTLRRLIPAFIVNAPVAISMFLLGCTAPWVLLTLGIMMCISLYLMHEARDVDYNIPTAAMGALGGFAFGKLIFVLLMAVSCPQWLAIIIGIIAGAKALGFFAFALQAFPDHFWSAKIHPDIGDMIIAGTDPASTRRNNTKVLATNE